MKNIRSKSSKSISKRRPFLLVEAIIALTIIGIVFFFFATPRASASFVAEKRARLETTKMATLALADLIQKVEARKIPWDTLVSGNSLNNVPIAQDWTASYQFTVHKSAPDNTPNLLLVEATVVLHHGEKSMETNSLTFCIHKI